MDTKRRREQLILEGRKREALEAFLDRLRAARERTNLPESPLEAYLLGLREGYGDGLAEGVRLGLDVRQDADDGYETVKVGQA